MLRDRLVCGINSKAVQRRFLQEPALTFDKALELALAAEAADKDSRHLLGGRLLGANSDKDLSLSKVEQDPPSSQTPVRRVCESRPQ